MYCEDISPFHPSLSFLNLEGRFNTPPISSTGTKHMGNKNLAGECVSKLSLLCSIVPLCLKIPADYSYPQGLSFPRTLQERILMGSSGGWSRLLGASTSQYCIAPICQLQDLSRTPSESAVSAWLTELIEDGSPRFPIVQWYSSSSYRLLQSSSA